MRKVLVVILFCVILSPVAAFGASLAGIWGNLQTDPNTAYFVVDTGTNTSSWAAYYGDNYADRYAFDVYNAVQNGTMVTVTSWWTSRELEYACTLNDAVHATSASCVITKCAPKQQQCGALDMPGNTAIIYKLL